MSLFEALQKDEARYKKIKTKIEKLEREMTTEEKLKAIIEDRKELNEFEFGCDVVTIDKKHCFGFWVGNKQGESCFYPSILEYLLKTEGCKTAYGDKPNDSGYLRIVSEYETAKEDEKPQTRYLIAQVPNFVFVTYAILETWHSGRPINMNNAISTYDTGNSWEAAIDTAYDLLPKE